ncbi:hypothetical protein NHX12_013236 [Muraenolepis orangiensis]|uniref:Uncharacterized protein n=1 Tax=Muraenolepis orangiensis TaxID=630683 RepID=A0A9Q0DEC1_9TELE|nr:hypothetical protein NHX12_013236 [Muraenolepis orangiensis]
MCCLSEADRYTWGACHSWRQSLSQVEAEPVTGGGGACHRWRRSLSQVEAEPVTGGGGEPVTGGGGACHRSQCKRKEAWRSDMGLFLFSNITSCGSSDLPKPAVSA